MVEIIYSLPNCHKCMKAKQLFPNAKYLLLSDIPLKEQKEIFSKCQEIHQISAPILIDKNGNVLRHEEVGLNG